MNTSDDGHQETGYKGLAAGVRWDLGRGITPGGGLAKAGLPLPYFQLGKARFS